MRQRAAGEAARLGRLGERVVSLSNHPGLGGSAGVWHFDRPVTDRGNSREPRWLSDRMVSLSNHSGFRASVEIGRAEYFDRPSHFNWIKNDEPRE